MNILFTSLSYYPIKGGAESCVQDLASAYVKRGHKVTVVTSSLPGLARRELTDGVTIIRLKYPPRVVTKLRDAFLIFFRGFSALCGLWGAVREQRIEIVCLGLIGIDSFLVLILSYLLRFKLIVYIHGGEIRSYVKISPLIRWTVTRCLRRCYAAIAVSEDLKSETIAFAPLARSKIFVIPNGVDIEAIQKQQGFNYPRKYFLFVGRLHPVKGINTLIEAFNQVSAQAPQLDLLVVGSGPLSESLRRTVADRGLSERIIFLDDRERCDVYALLKSCEFLVLCSQAEGSPIVVLEALAAGKITLGSRVKGIADIIRHEENGVLFQPGDVDELGKLILHYYEDQSQRSRLEQNIRTKGLDEYDLGRLCMRHLNVYGGCPEKLRICLLSPFFYHDANCSGLATYYSNLAESLVEEGHDVHLVTPSNGFYSSEKRVLSVKLKQSLLSRAEPGEARFMSLGRLAARLLFSFQAYRNIRELDRVSGIDIIVASELFAPALFPGFLMGHKLITRIHTPTYIADRYNQRYRFDVVGRILSFPEKIQVKRSAGLSVASEHLASVIEKDWRISRGSIKIIPNSVRTDWVRRLAARQSREIPGDYLLYFGRLERRKGVHIISRALPEVFSRRSDITMVFVGKDCGLRNEILSDNQRNREKIIFLDTLEKERLFGAIRYAKLVLLPSLFENASNAGLEAMVLGKPVIGTQGAFSEEIIRDNINGFLVEPGNARALTDKILSCLEMSDLERIGQNAYLSIASLDYRSIVQRNVEFYRETIAASGRR
jgi:glycosyltransferase involved in cell wall biosynthesis